jgi:hypothetical protein
VVFGAIERDQDMLAELPQGREPTMFFQLADDLAKEREELLGRHRIEQGADVVVGRDPRDAEQRLGIRAAVPFHQVTLVGQKRGALGEEDRERRQAELGHAVAPVGAGAPVGQPRSRAAPNPAGSRAPPCRS